MSNGHGSIFLWMFCAIAFLKVAQRFDSYLASIGLNVAQTGAGLGMELLVATRMITGAGRGFSSAGAAFGGGGLSPVGGMGGGFMAGFMNRFRGNSYVRDAVVQGGTKMGAGGAVGVVGRAFGGMAARNGATLTGNSIASVAARPPNQSGSIAGDIADRSLGNYMPHLNGQRLSGTQISGGRIETKAIGADGKETTLHLFSAGLYERPDGPSSTVTASDGSRWYQTASGTNAPAFFPTPHFTGDPSEAGRVGAFFPGAEDTLFRTATDSLKPIRRTGTPSGTTAATTKSRKARILSFVTPQEQIGMPWYLLRPCPSSRRGKMPQYTISRNSIISCPDMRRGSGTMFYDATQYGVPRGDYGTYEDINGHQWYSVHGDAAIEHRPIYENGKPVIEDGKIKTTTVDTVRYRNAPTRFSSPKPRSGGSSHPPRRK